MIITSPLLKQYTAVIAVNLMILCVGMDISWTSPVLVKLADPAQSPLSRPITDDESGWIVSIGYVFSMFTLPFIGLLADFVGRKRCLLMASLPKIGAGVITIFATEVWMLLVARAINLTMNTAVLLTIMVYSSEIASKEIRGSLGSLISILSCLGALVMLGVGPYVSYLHLSILVAISTVCAFILLLFVPDTPYSLYNQGKIEEAKKVLIFFRGSEELADEEIKEFSQLQPNQKFDKRELFRNRTHFKALIIVVLLGMGAHFNGFYFIMFYLQTVLNFTDTNISSALCSLIIGIIQVISSISASAISDRFGRKVIILTTYLGVAVGMVGLGTFFALKQHGTIISGFLNYLPLISIALITWCHSGGVGSQVMVLVTELLDDRFRAIGTSASVLASTASVFLQTRYTLVMLSAIGFVASFIMFGVICIMMSIFIFFFVPETRQKSFADIQKTLGVGDEERKDCVTRC